MGYIPSAETVYSVAYLTDTGREYLFNKNNTRFDSNGDDLFEITKFTLSDTDTNYKTQTLLDSGDVPDVTGKSEGCLKTTANYVQSNLVAFVFDGSPINVEYSTNLAIVNFTPGLGINEATLPSSNETPPAPLVFGTGPGSGGSSSTQQQGGGAAQGGGSASF